MNLPTGEHWKKTECREILRGGRARWRVKHRCAKSRSRIGRPIVAAERQQRQTNGGDRLGEIPRSQASRPEHLRRENEPRKNAHLPATRSLPFPSSSRLFDSNNQVCGIGNSGSEYLHTRHSIGRLMTDYLRDHFDYPVWVKDKSVSGFWSEKRENLILFKTGGFMNNAGRSVAAAYRKIRLGNTSRVLVIHDDLELPVGQVKLRTIGRGKYSSHPSYSSLMALMWQRT